MSILHINKRKEDFNKAMVEAVSASCGWTVGQWSQDMDLIDTTISKVIPVGGHQILKTVDFQLKCTKSPVTDNAEYCSFSLKDDHYQILKTRISGAPFILCVAVVPSDTANWVELITGVSQNKHQNMLLRHCSYARILHDSENLLDPDSKTVRFYKGKDEFSVPNLEKLETMMGSPEYNLARLDAEKEFWESQQ